MSTEGVAQVWEPACFEPDELAGWQEASAAARRAGNKAVLLPCDDCLSPFSKDMKRAINPEYPQGRCNGAPRGDQIVDIDPETVLSGGTSPSVGRGLSITRRVSLDVAAPPCESCAHEPVCSLRLALEGMATVETAAPPLPAGLRLSLAATIECDHFLRDRTKPAPVRVLTPQERGQAGLQARRISPEARARMNAGNTTRAAAKRATRQGAAAG